MSERDIPHGICDFCNYEIPKTCLSCLKIITYHAIKDAWLEFIVELDLKEFIDECIKNEK